MSVRNWVQGIPSQEAYALNKILFKVQHDRAEEVRFFADPEQYIGETDLSNEARTALASTDVGKLYELGVNPYLLRAYCLQLRMPEPDYLAALRAVVEK
jgi:Aromatic-ring-opening dioxygenase LigAB, LigA subunit